MSTESESRITLNILLTAEEKALIETEAKKLNLTMSTFIRLLARQWASDGKKILPDKRQEAQRKEEAIKKLNDKQAPD